MTRGTQSDMEMKLSGYRLATAEILYWMPDHPTLLQSFVWQHYDLVPEFPELHQFLKFWKESIDATLHSVHIAADQSMEPSRFRNAGAIYEYH